MSDSQAPLQSNISPPTSGSSSAGETPLAVPQETIDLVTAEHTTTITAVVSNIWLVHCF